jgi:hypothetical protein
VRGEVVDRYLCAVREEEEGDGAPDAGQSAGDGADLAREKGWERHFKYRYYGRRELLILVSEVLTVFIKGATYSDRVGLRETRLKSTDRPDFSHPPLDEDIPVEQLGAS